MNKKFGTKYIKCFAKPGAALVALAFTAFSAGTALAYIPSNGGLSEAPVIEKQITASAPLGFQIFCMQNAVECKSGISDTTAYTFRFSRLLAKVNRDINSAITPRNDAGVDKWTLNASIGDCEDYVLSKRSVLARAGIDVGALRIATATTFGGVGHAVLIVKTDKGEFVLDNRTNTIKRMENTDLIFHAISGVNPRKWTRMI